MEALLLGSGGWIPTQRRETCCALVRKGTHALVIDAGTGVQHLLEQDELLDGVERFDLVLTHFHLDHVIGLSYLPALPVKPVVWGPGALLVGASTRSILDRLLGPPLFAAALESIASGVREIGRGRLEIESFAISFRVQERHSEPTLAFRIDDVLTYCTDTAPDDANVAFAAGSRILLHEAWHARDSSSDPTHSAAGDAGRIARDAGVGRLVLIHVNPLQASDAELLAPAAAVFASSEVGVDLAILPLS